MLWIALIGQSGHKSKMIRSAFLVLSSLAIVLSACVTPSATSRPGIVWVPTPPEVDQYSDFLIGRYAYLTNDPALAAETAKRAAKRAPEDGFLLERAVSFMLLAGETDDAVKIARSGLKKASDIGAMTRLTLAADDFRNERYTLARDRLTNGDMDVFNRMIARSLAAWAAVGEDDAQGAKTHLIESFVGDNLFDGVNLYMLAFIQEMTGQEEEALQTFEAVWTERMRLAVAAEQYARLLASRGKTDDALAIVTQFRREIGPNPAVDKILHSLEAGEAVSARKLSPREGASLALYALGAAFAAETSADFAGAYFELALHINPDFDLARTMLGNTLDQAGRQTEAVDILAGIDRSSPFFATSRGQLAWVFLRMNNDDAAIETAQAAYAETKDRDLAIQIGDLHRALQDNQAAYDWFNRVVEQDEREDRSDWRPFYARALALDALDRWDEAERDLLKAVEIHPDQPEVLNYLGYSWVDRGVKLEEAFALIRRAVELNPRAGHIVDSLGWAYFRLGHYDKAVEHLERAVTLAAGDPVINDHLGDAYWRSGRHLEAGFQWKHALELETNEELRATIERKLKYGMDGAAISPVPLGSEPAANTQLP